MRESLREERTLWVTDQIAQDKFPEDLEGFYLLKNPPAEEKPAAEEEGGGGGKKGKVGGVVLGVAIFRLPCWLVIAWSIWLFVDLARGEGGGVVAVLPSEAQTVVPKGWSNPTTVCRRLNQKRSPLRRSLCEHVKTASAPLSRLPATLKRVQQYFAIADRASKPQAT